MSVHVRRNTQAGRARSRRSPATAAPPWPSCSPASPRTAARRTDPSSLPPAGPSAGTAQSASRPPWRRCAARTAPVPSPRPGRPPVSCGHKHGTGRQAQPQCSVTSKGCGSGRSNTCRATGVPTVSAADSTAPQPSQRVGRWSCTRSGVSVRCSVAPRCPGCPPERFPDRPRVLRVRCSADGLPGPSLDGGFPLLLLLRPICRSNCSSRCRRTALSASSCAMRLSCSARSASLATSCLRNSSIPSARSPADRRTSS